MRRDRFRLVCTPLERRCLTTTDIGLALPSAYCDPAPQFVLPELQPAYCDPAPQLAFNPDVSKLPSPLNSDSTSYLELLRGVVTINPQPVTSQPLTPPLQTLPLLPAPLPSTLPTLPRAPAIP